MSDLHVIGHHTADPEPLAKVTDRPMDLLKSLRACVLDRFPVRGQFLGVVGHDAPDLKHVQGVL